MSWAKEFGTSIFTKITVAANKAGALNLAQGFPDFDGPESIKNAAIQAIQKGGNQYAPSTGIPGLRKALSRRYKEKYDVHYDTDTEVTVVSGATEAIYLTIQSLHTAGDEIITFAPFYDSYLACAKLCGVKIKTVELSGDNWGFNVEDVEKQIGPKTKSILVNTPHNPTGKVFDLDEMKILADIARKHDLLVITDEVYEELVFDEHKHISMASLPGMKSRTITMSSAAKNFSMTGWKIGYICAPEHLAREIRAVHQFIVFCSATPLQYGIEHALSLGADYYDTYLREYRERRDLLCSILTQAQFKVYRPMGTYFIIADYSAISDKPDLEFAEWMIENKGVAAIPTSPFYLDQEKARREKRQLRFAFCKGVETLRLAAEKLN